MQTMDEVAKMQSEWNIKKLMAKTGRTALNLNNGMLK